MQAPSTAATARRTQIIAATIEVVAEVGYARTTFARIARRGGLSSTRLISYHFASKAELMRAIVDDTYRSINDFLLDRARTDAASRPIQPPEDGRPVSPPLSASAELRAYIRGVTAYVDQHRARMRAFGSIVSAVHDDPDSPALAQADPDGAVMIYLTRLLRRGQDLGEFQTADPLVLASMVQRTLEGLPQLLRHRPDLDTQVYAAELADAVTRAAGERHGTTT
ncbi:TetR/AcrR family transcriptional regulator [Georgenia deserti]|uniref:TetR/AcrR family transcriptional regulator n=1 Tax=Georgenia deserti TaxID=2093781 RepID=A0ABW4L7C6_9MICO